MLTGGGVAAAKRFRDYLNVRYYLDLKRDQGLLGAALKLDRTGDLDVYESTGSWPRAFFTDRAGSYAAVDGLVHAILTGDGRPVVQFQQSDGRAAAAPGPYAADPAGRTIVPADRYRLTEDSTSFEISAPTPGIVVLAEAYWPGYAKGRAGRARRPPFSG